VNLVLIETSGNQLYIFATNRLRENVGASDLTYQVGKEFVLQAVDSINGGNNLYTEDPVIQRNRLLNQSPLESGNNAAEVIVATSGKALLLVKDEQVGRKVVHDVTLKALKEAPGIAAHGAISESFSDLGLIHKSIREVRNRLEDVRFRIPGPEQRFLRLPFVEPCRTSGLPASRYQLQKKEAWSQLTIHKDRNADGGRQRMERAISEVTQHIGLLKNIDAMERRFKSMDWLGVIHADGNGLGQVFLNFDNYTRGDGRNYLNKYREFSIALDICAMNAIGHALAQMQKSFDRDADDSKLQSKNDLPVIPLIVGGDDLTVLCDGKYAMQFAYDFLTKFEEETGKDDEKHCGGVIAGIAESALGVRRLSACAGVAIVKPHFPFHAAYNLAENLSKSAKQVKERVTYHHNNTLTSWPCSALDYHILYDSSGADLDRIRNRMPVDENMEAAYLYARPYVVTRETPPEIRSREWTKHRTWEKLASQVKAMSKPDSDDENHRALPNSMLHDLREGLFMGRKGADARMKLYRKRYQHNEFDKLLADAQGEGSLFWKEEREDKGDKKIVYVTGFLDALDLIEFCKFEDEEKQ
jgi:CRISPR RNA silencing complex Cmr2 subunit-like protein